MLSPGFSRGTQLQQMSYTREGPTNFRSLMHTEMFHWSLVPVTSKDGIAIVLK